MTDTFIIRPDGQRLDYSRPPRADQICTWSKRTTGGKQIRASFRTIAFLDRMNRLALHRWDEPLSIIQGPYNTGVPASAGTHDLDGPVDWWVNGVDPWDMQRWWRANGGWGWYRHLPLFGNHQHGGCVPPQSGVVRADDYADNQMEVGIYVPGQLDDYYRHAFGLSGQHTTGSDRSWFPESIKARIFNLDAFIARRLRDQKAA